MSGSRRRTFGQLIPLAGVVVIGYTVVALNVGVAFAVPGFVMLVGGAVGFLFTPLGRALSRSLEAEAGVEPALPAADVLAELDELRSRVAELEERQDFSERMLGQRQDARALHGEGK